MADLILEHMMILRSQLVQEVIKLDQKRAATLRNIKETDRMLLGRDPTYRPDEVPCMSPAHHEELGRDPTYRPDEVPCMSPAHHEELEPAPHRQRSRMVVGRGHAVQNDRNNPWREIMPVIYRIIREGGNKPLLSDFIFQQLRQHFNIKIQGNNPSRVLITRLERDPELIDCSEHHFALVETSTWLVSPQVSAVR